MFRLTRITAEPASPLKIMIAKPSGADAGLADGGSFVVEPGDVIQVDDYAAGVIMGDPGLAKHFDCLPPWRGVKAADAADATDPEPAPVAKGAAARKAGSSW